MFSSHLIRSLLRTASPSRSSFSVFKNLNMDNLSKIGTHDGTFHCDEVLGCYLLKCLSPNAEIVRSRNLDVLNTCDIVIDVGGKYDPEKKLFDHHQKEFDVTAARFIPGKPLNIKLSSAGLVYCHYGKLILKKILGDIENSVLDVMFLKVYEGFIEEIDAIDNGVPISGDGNQAYYISTHLSARVKHLNPSWNESNPDVDLLFRKAMKLVGEEFEGKIQRLYKEWLPARSIVLNAINNRLRVDPSGEIIELEQFCPWTSHLFDLEKELNIPEIKYVLFPASLERTVWRVQSVPLEDSSFVLRKPLNEKWRGLRDNELCDVSGINGCIFVHSSGFIGGNNSKDGALEMAQKSL